VVAVVTAVVGGVVVSSVGIAKAVKAAVGGHPTSSIKRLLEELVPRSRSIDLMV
jgi:hypothetical protein